MRIVVFSFYFQKQPDEIFEIHFKTDRSLLSQWKMVKGSFYD